MAEPNNNFNPNFYNPYGGMGTMQYNGYPQQTQAKVNNYLTAEEIKELQQDRSTFSLGLTKKDQLRAKCNHRSPDGTHDTLVDTATGLMRCEVCGYEFRPLDASESIDSIKDASDRIVDILQTIKLLYTDLPAEAASEYFQIIPLIEKMPQLFDFAAKNFAKHDIRNAWSYNNYNMGGIAMLQNLGALYSGMGQQQQMYGQPNPQQPYGNMAAGYPDAAYQQPMNNQFGYAGASQQPQYAPQTAGYSFTPNQQPTAPAAPAQATTADAAKEDTTTVTQTVTA